MRILLTLVLAGLVRCACAQAAATAGVPLSRDDFVAALARDLTAHFKLEGELQLELLRPWAPPAFAAGVWTVTVVEFPPVPASSMLLRFRVQADGRALGDATMTLRASLWREAWVSVQPLVSGATFDAAQLEPRRVDLLRDRDAVPVSVGDRTYVFARAIPAGRLLSWRDLTRRPLVKKGQIVEVSAAEGMLFVSMKALAMENGARGDTVTVRNPESQKNFAAKVVDENRVQVHF